MLELKSSTESNKCALKVSGGGDKDLEKVVHVDKLDVDKLEGDLKMTEMTLVPPLVDLTIKSA